MTRKKKTPLFADLKISSINHKGHGLGVWNREEQQNIVEVPFTMPGDEVQCRIQTRRNKIAKGTLEDIIKPSSERIPSKCIHFGVCGGCRLQHMSYEDQLKFREELVLKEFADQLNPDVKIYPIEPCASPWEYRNKMEYTFSSDKAGTKYLGLIKEGTQRQVLNLTECFLTHPWFIDVLKAVKQWWMESDLNAYNLSRDVGTLRNLVVREGYNTNDRMVILHVSGNPDYALKQHQLNQFIAFVRDAVEPKAPIDSKLSIFLCIHQVGKGITSSFYEMHLYGPDHIKEKINITLPHIRYSVTLRVSPSAFLQPNTRQAEKLYSKALQLAEISETDIVYDLYAGISAFGICAAKLAKQVVSVELMPESTLDGKQNVLDNECSNIEVVTGAVRHVLNELRSPLFSAPNVILVDPPRAGLDPIARENIVQFNAKKIIYVSCNPRSQAADVKEFIKAGYQLRSIQPIDQFPQTAHVENIVLLEKI